MDGVLLRASSRAVRREAVAGPVLAAVVLIVTTIPVLDNGYAMQVLRGVGALLGMAFVVAMDDPSREVLAASPYTAAQRAFARLAFVAATVVPVWVFAAAVIAWRSDVPIGGLGLEALALWSLGLAVASAVWRWSGATAPSYVAGPLLLVLVLGANSMPHLWVLMQQQTWGPPWVASQLRWASVLLAGLAVVSIALRDPLDRRSRRRSDDPSLVRHDDRLGSVA